MDDVIEKLGTNSVKLKREIPAKMIERIYDIDFLVSQKAQIEGEIAKHQVELDKVIDLIAKAAVVGVVPSVVEGISE